MPTGLRGLHGASERRFYFLVTGVLVMDFLVMGTPGKGAVITGAGALAAVLSRAWRRLSAWAAVAVLGCGLYCATSSAAVQESSAKMPATSATTAPAYVQLNDHVAVAGQIQPHDMAAIAAAGYRLIVNNRPDGEAPDQPSSAVLQAAAQAAGLEYRYYPLNAFNYPGNDVAAIGALFDDPAKPAFAFCRSGTRSTNLWISSRAPDDREPARQHARQLGFDVSLSLK